jgi:hypothetical protein
VWSVQLATYCICISTIVLVFSNLYLLLLLISIFASLSEVAEQAWRWGRKAFFKNKSKTRQEQPTKMDNTCASISLFLYFFFHSGICMCVCLCVCFVYSAFPYVVYYCKWISPTKLLFVCVYGWVCVCVCVCVYLKLGCLMMCSAGGEWMKRKRGWVDIFLLVHV